MTKEYSDYLAHYGIPHMKKGVRRWQNKDGSYTEEGRIHYGIGDPREPADSEQKNKDATSEGKSRLSDIQTKPHAFTQKEAERNKEQLKTVLKVAAGVTVAAALAYGGYKVHKWLSPRLNRSVKTGSELYRVHSNPNDNAFGRTFYATTNKNDARKYRGIFGGQKIQEKKLNNIFANFSGDKTQKEVVYQSVGKAQGKIKIAGDRAGQKAYESLMKNDKEFAKAIKDRGEAGVNPFNIGDPTDKNPRVREYKRFNQWLVDHDDGQEKLSQKFYAELRKRGFGGVVDVNDRDYSGYNAKAARIIFDTEKVKQTKQIELPELFVSASKDLAVKDILRQRKQSAKAEAAAKAARRLMYSSASLTGVAGLSLAKQNAEERRLIREYRKEHPNTKKTDAGILEIIRG